MPGVDISKALTIEGWMLPEELTWLAEMASAARLPIVEIGSWMGRSTRALADNSRVQVYAVDTWRGDAATQKYLEDKPDDWLFTEFRKNIRDRIQAGDVVPMRQSSRMAAMFFENTGFKADMVFIDGAHDYESVKADIFNWRPFVSPTGILCGHDWGNEGVHQALAELLPNAMRVTQPIGSIWADCPIPIL